MSVGSVCQELAFLVLFCVREIKKRDAPLADPLSIRAGALMPVIRRRMDLNLDPIFF